MKASFWVRTVTKTSFDKSAEERGQSDCSTAECSAALRLLVLFIKAMVLARVKRQLAPGGRRVRTRSSCGLWWIMVVAASANARGRHIRVGRSMIVPSPRRGVRDHTPALCYKDTRTSPRIKASQPIHSHFYTDSCHWPRSLKAQEHVGRSIAETR